MHLDLLHPSRTHCHGVRWLAALTATTISSPRVLLAMCRLGFQTDRECTSIPVARWSQLRLGAQTNEIPNPWSGQSPGVPRPVECLWWIGVSAVEDLIMGAQVRDAPESSSDSPCNYAIFCAIRLRQIARFDGAHLTHA